MRTVILAVTLVLTGCSSAPAPESGGSSAKSPPAPAAKPSPVRITQFYASPPNPAEGETTSVCYGVENATEVRLDPAVEKVYPAYSHCFQYKPTKPVTLTLTASRGREQVSKTLEIHAGPHTSPPVALLEVSVGRVAPKPGDTVSVCYTASNAVKVTVKPGEWIEPHSNGVGCVSDHPSKPTEYTVTATGAGGDVVTRRVTAGGTGAVK